MQDVQVLADAAAGNPRTGQRDRLMILFAARHGLRVSELITVRWSDLNLTSSPAIFQPHRLKKRRKTVEPQHPIPADELADLKSLWKAQGKPPQDAFVFPGHHGRQLQRHAVSRTLDRLATVTGLKCTPHGLRHAAGYHWTGEGMPTAMLADYLGHASVETTRIYTSSDAAAFAKYTVRS